MLGVAYNPTYPTIIDVDGLDINFSVSATGTTGGKINITGIGHLVDVWMGTGSFSNIAYVQWLLGYVSRNNWGQVFLPDPADPMIYTLSGITTGSSITGESIHAGTAVIALAESNSSIYYGETTSNFVTKIHRKGLAGNTSFDGSLSLTGSNQGVYIASVVDGELYGLCGYGSYGDTGNRTLLFYDMNNGTITQKYTDAAAHLETWHSLAIIGDHGSEYLVAMSTCGTGSAYGAYARVFDATDGTLIRKTGINYIQTSVPHAKAGGGSIHLAPQIYDGKVIYSFSEAWNHSPNTPWNPPDIWHWTGVLIYDPYTGAYGMARVENDVNLFRDVTPLENGMDYLSGYYYWFETQTEPTYSPPIKENRLYRSTVALSPSIAAIEIPDVDDYIEFVTGKERIYSVYYKSGNIKKTATAELVGNAPFSITGSTTTGFSQHLDETDQRVWFVNAPTSASGTLYGVSVLGEDDKIISLAGGTFVDIPFLLSMNLVEDGVMFTSALKLGLAQK